MVHLSQSIRRIVLLDGPAIKLQNYRWNNEHGQLLALTALVPHLPHMLFGEVLALVQAFADEHKKLQGLETLALHLPPSLLDEALALAQMPARAQALAALLLRLTELSPERLYYVWCDTLRTLAIGTRQQLLTDLCVLQSRIDILNGRLTKETIVCAIQDVGQWWP